MRRLRLMSRFLLLFFQTHYWSIYNDPENYKAHMRRLTKEFRAQWRQTND